MSIDLSLDRLRKLVIHLPPYTRPTIHIAGTNGKGSVSALLTSILLSSYTSKTQDLEAEDSAQKDSSRPLRIGRYNSPHLTTVLDCITIDNTPVTQPVYDEVRRKVEEADREHRTHLSGFEILTLTALQIFEGALCSSSDKQGGVDVVILEVGMGGRLDATNIVPSSCILASALTAVDLDHQAFLGNTIDKITREKAGIAREGKPFVLGRQSHGDVVNGVVRDVVGGLGGEVVDAVDVARDDEREDQEQAPFTLLPSSSNTANILSRPRSYPGAQHIIATLPCFSSLMSSLRTSLPLHGAHQLDNLSTALSVIGALITHPSPAGSDLHFEERITPETIRTGVQSVSWPGRLSFHTIDASINDGSDSGTGSTTQLLVLADGAHNSASAKTLGAYVDQLVEMTQKDGDRLALLSTGHQLAEETILPITYILCLSHSPPKTPLEVLQPLFSSFSFSSATRTIDATKSKLKPQLSVALIPFTPPDGMPWVKPVPSDAMGKAIKVILPAIADKDIFSRDSSGGQESAQPGGNVALEEALRWAARRHGRLDLNNEEGKPGPARQLPGLVVVAGSLYLVADFYRMLDSRSLA